MQQYMNESVGVRTPEGKHASLRIPVKYTEDDIDIAIRLASGFTPGTILSIAQSKFKILSQDPPKVAEVKKGSGKTSDRPPKSDKTLTAKVHAEVGQEWVTKDSRRKQEPFKVVKIEDGSVITDKGARIQLHRLNRYRLVS